jgi:hypothetical protein
VRLGEIGSCCGSLVLDNHSVHAKIVAPHLCIIRNTQRQSSPQNIESTSSSSTHSSPARPTGRRYCLFPRNIVSRFLSSPYIPSLHPICLHSELTFISTVHTVPHVHTLPLFANFSRLSKNKYDPRPAFDLYMATLRGIVTSELPPYRLKMLSPAMYRSHHFGTHLNMQSNR